LKDTVPAIQGNALSITQANLKRDSTYIGIFSLNERKQIGTLKQRSFNKIPGVLN